MDVHCIVNQTVKLSVPTEKIRLRKPLAYNNSKAHAMRVTVMNDDNTEANLAGVGVTATFLKKSNHVSVEPINGTVSGNVAQVILPASCYVTPGRYEFTMNLTDTAGASRTVLWVEGIVEQNASESIVDPGTPVSNISQAIGNANAAASDALSAAADTRGAISAAREAAKLANAAASQSVRYDAAQTLTNAQQARARSNVAAASDADLLSLSAFVSSLGLYLDDDGYICQR